MQRKKSARKIRIDSEQQTITYVFEKIYTKYVDMDMVVKKDFFLAWHAFMVTDMKNMIISDKGKFKKKLISTQKHIRVNILELLLTKRTTVNQKIGAVLFVLPVSICKMILKFIKR
jgi:hypothetical protein